MTKLICLLMLMLPLRFSAIAADPVDHAADLIKNGKAAELGRMFASTVDLTILADQQVYSNSQATAAVDRFFKSNPVRSVKVIHRINSNATLKYAVMSVETANGNYRVSISLKAAGGDFQISELRIEAEK